MSEKVLITGVSGCIGAATVAWLRERGGDDIVGMTRSGESNGVACIAGDVADFGVVESVVNSVRPTRIIHLAAFQMPDCQAKPTRGMEINVGGTQNLLRAAAGLGDRLKRVVFASSAAVYGARDIYPGGSVTEHDPCLPPHLYGFWKMAGEGMMQAFHMETNVAAVSLRLATTYGPGRDRGLTAAPTTAIKAAALGVAYEVPYFGREHYHFVEDVAAAFGQTAVDAFSGYGVFNLRGITVKVSDFLSQLQECAKEQGVEGAETVRIALDADPFPFVCDLDDSLIQERFPGVPLTPLKEGIGKSLEVFRKEAETGLLALI